VLPAFTQPRIVIRAVVTFFGRLRNCIEIDLEVAFAGEGASLTSSPHPTTSTDAKAIGSRVAERRCIPTRAKDIPSLGRNGEIEVEPTAFRCSYRAAIGSGYMQETSFGHKPRPRGFALVRLVWNTPGTRLHLLSLVLVITGAILWLSSDSWTPTFISLAGVILGFVAHFRQRRYFERQRQLDSP
jgi:hypothetical protein